MRIANDFNVYFIESINQIVMKVVAKSSMDCNVVINNSEYDVSLNKFDNITTSELKKFVKALKNVSGGESGISTKVFKDVWWLILLQIQGGPN